MNTLNKLCFLPLSAFFLSFSVHADLTREDRLNSCLIQTGGIKRLFCFDYAVNNNLLPAMEREKEVKSCASVVNETQRLACYDSATKDIKKKAIKTFGGGTDKSNDVSQNEGNGNWSVYKDKSPIDDSENVQATLPATSSVRTRFGEMITPDLVVSCHEGKTELYIDWKQYLGIGSTMMIHRIDTSKAVNKTWTLSTNNEAVFYHGKTIGFIKELTNGKSLFTKITPYGENPVETNFELKGISKALEPIRKACKW